MLLFDVSRKPAAESAGNTCDASTPSAKRIFTTGSPARFVRWNESSADKLESCASERATICPSVPVNWAADAVAKSDNAAQADAKTLMIFVLVWLAFRIVSLVA
jgi:hypothetical protein